MVIGTTCSLILTKHISPPVIFILQCRIVDKTSRHNLSWTCVIMAFVLWSSPNHMPIKYRCRIKKSNQITPTYLKESIAGAIKMFSWLVLRNPMSHSWIQEKMLLLVSVRVGTITIPNFQNSKSSTVAYWADSSGVVWDITPYAQIQPDRTAWA